MPPPAVAGATTWAAGGNRLTGRGQRPAVRGATGVREGGSRLQQGRDSRRRRVKLTGSWGERVAQPRGSGVGATGTPPQVDRGAARGTLGRHRSCLAPPVRGRHPSPSPKYAGS